MLKALGDPLLGHTTIDERHYFVRQMKNMKASMPMNGSPRQADGGWRFIEDAPVHDQARSRAYRWGGCPG